MKKILFCLFLLSFHYNQLIKQAINAGKSYYDFYITDGIPETFYFDSQGIGSYYLIESKYVKKNDHQLKIMQITIRSGYCVNLPFDYDYKNTYITTTIESFEIDGKEI